VAEAATKPKRTRKKGAKTVARAYFDALSAKDVDAAVALWRPGAIDRLHGVVELRAPAEVQGYFESLFRAIPDWGFEILDIVGSGDLAAVRWRARGTFDGTGKFQGLTPTGASIDVQGCDMVRVEEGEIVENNGYVNGTQIAQQLGVLPAPESVGERGMTGLVNARTAATQALRRFRERR
jgi:predicted ester cyclase